MKTLSQLFEIITEDEKAYQDIVTKYINNIGRYFAELEKDFKDLKFDSKQYPEVASELREIKKLLKNRKIKIGG